MPEPGSRDSLEREVAAGLAHPRGTEMRRLGPYREALHGPSAYAALAATDRDAIVHWAEVRRRMAARGVDSDPRNLADPLVDAGALRGLVVEGERLAGGGRVDDDGGDLIALVGRMRDASA